MKITDFAKFFTVVTACLTVGSAVGAATYNCQQQDIKRKFLGIDWANAITQKNNFLFQSRTMYNQNRGFACGHEKVDGCDHNVILLMPATHVFQGNDMHQVLFYTCNSNGYNAWQSLGSTSSHVQECWDKTWTNAGMRSRHIDAGDRHYFCSHMDNGVCIDKMGAGTSDICWMSNERYNCLNKGGQWNKGDRECSCAKSGYIWDKNTEKCIKDSKTEAQECYNRKGYLDGAGACRCHDNEWFDPNQPNPSIPGGKGLCRPQSQCPSASGYTCQPGQVININNSNTFGDIGSNNPTNVDTNQQNQQVTEVGQEQTQGQTSENSNNNSSESNSSNTNNNNSNNGNTTVNGDGNNVNTGNGNGNGGSSSLQQCLASRSTANGKACCYLPKTGSRGAQYDDTTDTCKCNDGGKTFSIAANGHGQCTGGGNVKPDPYGPTPQCSDRMYYNATEKRCMCSAENQTEIKNNTACKCAITGATNDANGNCKCDDPKKVIVDGQCVYANTQCPNGMQFNTSNGECECTGAYQRKVVKNGVETCECTVPGAKNDAYGVCKCNEEGKVVDANGKCSYDENAIVNIRAKITASYGKLNSTMGGFEKSVWKDAEGNFNTARLASDSIAGVVLGTAGGIITSKLVKKNQLKTGFEDIKCAIGGQNVASYGDSFSVGM